MNHWTEHDVEKRMESIREAAWNMAGEQMNIAELYLRRHPDEHPDFHRALQKVLVTEEKMTEKVDSLFADECQSAYMSFAGTLAMETYLRGVMDGARMYHAIITHELPDDKKD